MMKPPVGVVQRPSHRGGCFAPGKALVLAAGDGCSVGVEPPRRAAVPASSVRVRTPNLRDMCATCNSIVLGERNRPAAASRFLARLGQLRRAPRQPNANPPPWRRSSPSMNELRTESLRPGRPAALTDDVARAFATPLDAVVSAVAYETPAWDDTQARHLAGLVHPSIGRLAAHRFDPRLTMDRDDSSRTRGPAHATSD